MQSSTLSIISANERKQEITGIKGCLFGRSGIGKTSQLLTLPTETLFVDLEAGDLAVKSWKGDTLRPLTWQDCRNLAVILGGPKTDLRDDQAYSQKHYTEVCKLYSHASEIATKYGTIFIDSLTEACRLCLEWCKNQQPYSGKSSKSDMWAVYSAYNQEMFNWVRRLRCARYKDIWLVGILDEKVDENGIVTYSFQLEGSKFAAEFSGIVDEIIIMTEIISPSGKPTRVFVCQNVNEYGYKLAKDRSRNLGIIEEPDLGKLTKKIKSVITALPTADDVALAKTDGADYVTNLSTTNNEVIYDME